MIRERMEAMIPLFFDCDPGIDDAVTGLRCPSTRVAYFAVLGVF